VGLFKKIGRGIKKAFKKIGKGIKKVFKAIGGAGILGQIGLMFILPGLGGLLGGATNSLLSGSMGALGKGVGHIMATAGKFASTAKNMFSTVTEGITSFFKKVGGTMLKKAGIPLKGVPDGTLADAFKDWKDGVLKNASQTFDPWKMSNVDYAKSLIPKEAALTPEGAERAKADLKPEEAGKMEVVEGGNPSTMTRTDQNNFQAQVEQRQIQEPESLMSKPEPKGKVSMAGDTPEIPKVSDAPLESYDPLKLTLNEPTYKPNLDKIIPEVSQSIHDEYSSGFSVQDYLGDAWDQTKQRAVETFSPENVAETVIDTTIKAPLQQAFAGSGPKPPSQNLGAAYVPMQQAEQATQRQGMNYGAMPSNVIDFSLALEPGASNTYLNTFAALKPTGVLRNA
jgi:hypothetical protein